MVMTVSSSLSQASRKQEISLNRKKKKKKRKQIWELGEQLRKEKSETKNEQRTPMYGATHIFFFACAPVCRLRRYVGTPVCLSVSLSPGDKLL